MGARQVTQVFAHVAPLRRGIGLGEGGEEGVTGPPVKGPTVRGLRSLDGFIKHSEGTVRVGEK